MCGKAVSKVFGGSKPDAPTPAVAVAAPNATEQGATQTAGEANNVRAKGKKRLTINNAGASTGVNL